MFKKYILRFIKYIKIIEIKKEESKTGQGGQRHVR
jgi:hypothetical protein